MERIPASERTSQKLHELLTQGVADGDARTELIRLAVRKIIEEALEAEVDAALGRGYYESGAAPGAGYRNGLSARAAEDGRRGPLPSSSTKGAGVKLFAHPRPERGSGENCRAQSRREIADRRKLLLDGQSSPAALLDTRACSNDQDVHHCY